MFKAECKQGKREKEAKKDADKMVRKGPMTWGVGEGHDKIKATWLGHASVLIELPAPHTTGNKTVPTGPLILFDPVLCKRITSKKHFGYRRIAGAYKS